MEEQGGPGGYYNRLTTLDGEVKTLQGSVNTLSTSVGGMKSDLANMAANVGKVFAVIDGLSDKMDKQRVGIGAIWAPLAAVTAILVATVSVVSGPYIERLRNVEEINFEHMRASDAREAQQNEVIARLRENQAVLTDRSGRPI